MRRSLAAHIISRAPSTTTTHTASKGMSLPLQREIVIGDVTALIHESANGGGARLQWFDNTVDCNFVRIRRLGLVPRPDAGAVAVFAAYSPDGALGAVSWTSGAVSIFSTATGDVVCVAQHHVSSVNLCRFSPCGRYLGSVGTDGTIVILSAAQGWQMIARLDLTQPGSVHVATSVSSIAWLAFKSQLYFVASSRNGATVASPSAIRLYRLLVAPGSNVVSVPLVRVWPAHTSYIRVLIVVVDEERDTNRLILISASGDSTCKIWHLSPADLTAAPNVVVAPPPPCTLLQGTSRAIETAHLMRHPLTRSRVLVLGDFSGQMCFFDVEDELRSGGDVNDDGRQKPQTRAGANASKSAAAAAWSSSSPAAQHEMDPFLALPAAHLGELYSVASEHAAPTAAGASAAGGSTLLLTAANDGFLRAWDTRTMSPLLFEDGCSGRGPPRAVFQPITSHKSGVGNEVSSLGCGLLRVYSAGGDKETTTNKRSGCLLGTVMSWHGDVILYSLTRMQPLGPETVLSRDSSSSAAAAASSPSLETKIAGVHYNERMHVLRVADLFGVFAEIPVPPSLRAPQQRDGGQGSARRSVVPAGAAALDPCPCCQEVMRDNQRLAEQLEALTQRVAALEAQLAKK